MEKITLNAKKRDVTGKKMRAQADKKIPAVVYGNDVKPQNLWIDTAECAKAFDEAGANIIVSLAIDGGKPINVLFYDVQEDPVTDEFMHIDFYAVNMKEEVEAEIPLEFVGESAAVKELGGTLVKNNDSLVVRALPADLPREITVDLSKLKTFDDRITVEDVNVEKGVTIILDDDAIIASVLEPRSDEELAELDSDVDVDVSQVEGAVEESDEETAEGANEEKTEKPDEEKKEE